MVLTYSIKVAREPSCERVCASKFSRFENHQLLHLVSQEVQDYQTHDGDKCLKRKSSDASTDSSGFLRMSSSPPKHLGQQGMENI